MQESGARSRLDIASTRGLTPLVGREQEVGLLFERWEQAQNGHGQVVLLSGEAGIGKSRLLQVLKDHVAEETRTRLECRSSPYFTNSALYPITDFLQRTLRFQADDTSEQKLEKLIENFRQYRLPLEDTVPLFASLVSLPIPEDRYPTLNLTPQRQRQKTLEAIIAIILELSERQPVLFILEDLHWTDPTTLEFIELLIDQTPTTSLCVLVTCRPEFQPPWQHRSYLTEMTLNRLSRSQIESIATRVAGGKVLPGEVIRQLVERTDGVPLYVEEMTKAVLESGVLKESDGQYELTGPVSSLAIPTTLHDSLMARLDRLVTAKVVAQYAAVIGRQFSYALLREVSQLDEATLQRELGRLVAAELVYQRGSPPQSAYRFKHALIQDTAYELLLRSTRQGYHQRIAQVLEERFPETAETQPELLAHHYTQAGLNKQAVEYWQQAGEKAIQRSAHVEAVPKRILLGQLLILLSLKVTDHACTRMESVADNYVS
jgi:predicted ATPase